MLSVGVMLRLHDFIADMSVLSTVRAVLKPCKRAFTNETIAVIYA